MDFLVRQTGKLTPSMCVALGKSLGVGLYQGPGDPCPGPIREQMSSPCFAASIPREALKGRSDLVFMGLQPARTMQAKSKNVLFFPFFSPCILLAVSLGDAP